MSFDLAGYPRARAPEATTRLVPSRFPPIPAFDAVSSAEDLAAVLELVGWTDDRLAGMRLRQLPPASRVHGRPDASVVMAAFLHGSPGGQRFSGPELGAWYASSELATAVLEVANGIRKEMSLAGLGRKVESYRRFTARLVGAFVDIFGRHPEFHDPDEASWPAAQAFGRHVRDEGAAAGCVGIRYQGVRHPGHANWVCFVPAAVEDVIAGEHYELDVPPRGKVVVRRLD